MEEKFKSLVDKIKDKQKNNIFFNNQDNDWKTFIQDHKVYFHKTSNTNYLSLIEKEKYTNDLNGFLRHLSYPIEISWIIKIINNINPFENFTERDMIFIPEISDIETLYRKYKTSTKIQS